MGAEPYTSCQRDSTPDAHYLRTLIANSNNTTLDMIDVEGLFVWCPASMFNGRGRKGCRRDRRRGRGIHNRERSLALHSVLDIQA